MTGFPPNIVELVNQGLGGFNIAMGLRFTRIEDDELVCELEVGEHHTQPYGLVHGGVYAGMIESACSTGAALSVYHDRKSAVGLENSTAFLRAVRSGVLTCSAHPLMSGRRSQVWEATVTDDQGRLAAKGRVRMIVLEKGSAAGGQTIVVKELLEE